jgi:FkbM family methyltransferase
MRAFTWLIGCLRAIIRLLQTQSAHVHPVEKLLRGGLLVPFFGCLLVLLRIRAAVLGPLRIETITTDGDRFACHLPDLIQMYLHVFGVWEPDLAAFIRARVNANDVFVDVGANIGFDSLLASHAIGAAGRVIAIEASPAVFDRLRETLRLNGSPTNVRAINKAVAEKPGTLNIYAGPQHNLGLTTTVQRGDMPQVARVEAAPLGDLLQPDEFDRVRLIKIDVEGGEAAVLAGLVACIDRLPPEAEIAVELSPLWWSDRTRTARDVLQPFVERGYRIFTIPNNYWPWRYLWPNDVRRPRRLRDESILTKPIKRLDVILSRQDSEQL